VCGVLFVTVIGNLSQVQLIYNGIRGLSTIPTQDGSTWMTYLAQFFDGLSHWLADHKLATIHTDWWYWNATRVIPPGQGEAGPINEMPLFTFLFGDLHAHAMALPYTLLVLGLAVNILRDRFWRTDQTAWWRDPAEILTLGLLALATGALWPINTWDFPTYLLLATAALALREYARRGRVDGSGLWAVAWRAGLVVVAGRLLFQPYHSAYAGSYFGAELWKGTQTAIKPYLLIHGFFLFIIGSYLVADLLFMPGHNFLVLGFRRKLRFLHLPVDEPVEAQKTAGHKVLTDLFWITFAVGVVILFLKPVIGLALLFSLLAFILLLSARPDPLRQFVRLMILLGLLLTAVVEVVVLKGDISRMNTVFKFYLQVWVLWAVASAAVLPELARLLRVEKAQVTRPPVPDLPEGSAWTPELAAQFEALRRRPAKQTWARRWWLVFSLLLGACLLYPLTAIPARLGDRFPGSTSITLDGSAYMETSTYYDEGRPVELKWDYQAIDWLRRNVSGLPAILEANTPLYRWGSRISINTGLPTLIGWDWHEKQQRSVVPGQIIDQRLQDVKTIYTTTDIAQAKELLQQYGITYIYLGPVELLYYPGDGLKKFYLPDNGWTPVYQNEQVTIFKVQ
jgi:YYY domain-containing protein